MVYYDDISDCIPPKDMVSNTSANLSEGSSALQLENDEDEFPDIDIFSYRGVPFGVIGGGVLEEEDDSNEDEDEESDDDEDDSLEDYADEKDSVKKKKKKDKDKKKDKSRTKKSEEKKIKKIDPEKISEEKAKIKRQEAIAKARKKAEKERLRLEQEKKDAETDVIRLMARRDYIHAHLAKLDHSKRKDAIKIANLNIELRNIEASIATLQRQYNLPITTVHQGSWLSRSWSKFKNFVKKKWNRVKSFFKRNKDAIIGIASIAAPLAASVLTGIVIKR